MEKEKPEWVQKGKKAGAEISLINSIRREEWSKLVDAEEARVTKLADKESNVVSDDADAGDEVGNGNGRDDEPNEVYEAVMSACFKQNGGGDPAECREAERHE